MKILLFLLSLGVLSANAGWVVCIGGDPWCEVPAYSMLLPPTVHNCADVDVNCSGDAAGDSCTVGAASGSVVTVCNQNIDSDKLKPDVLQNEYVCHEGRCVSK